MNLSPIITHLKMAHNLNSITLPLIDDITGERVPAENAIRDVITKMTIPVYSQYIPWIREIDANVNSLEVVDRYKHIYKLPKGICTTPVLYVADVRMPYISNRGTYGDISPAYGISQSVEGVVTSQAMMMVAGQMRAEPSFKDLGANQVRLFGFPKTVLTFVAACEHEPNGETIEPACYQSFLTLADLDLKVYLYGLLKYYENMPTAFGTLSMKSEEYSSATPDRSALLKEWDEIYHLDQIENLEYM